MRQIFLKSILLLLIIALASCSVPDDLTVTFDPIYGADAYTGVDAKSYEPEFGNKLLVYSEKAATDVRISYVHLEGSSFTKSTLDLTKNTADISIVAKSPSLNCMVVQDVTTGAGLQTIKAYKFPETTSAPTSILISDSTATTIVANPATPLTAGSVSVSDDCTALRIGAKAYHYKVASPFWEEDAIATAWTNPILNADHSIAVEDAGIWTYESAGKRYVKNGNAESYLTNKKVYSTADKLVIFSYQTNTTNTAYKIHFFKYTGTVFELVQKIDAFSFGTANLPVFTISSSLKVAYIKYKSMTGSNDWVYEGRSINYALKVVTTFQSLTFFATGTSSVSVSDKFVFARRSDNKFQGWRINGAKLIPYLATLYDDTSALTWRRAIIQNNAVDKLQVIFTTLDGTDYKYAKQAFDFQLNVASYDSKNSAARTLSAEGIQAVKRSAKWFIQGTVSTDKDFQVAQFTPPSTITTKKKTLTNTYSPRAGSTLRTCFVFATAAAAQVWDLNTNNPGTVKKDITSLITGLGATIAGVNNGSVVVDISDDCSILSINGKLHRWEASVTNYELDSFISNITIPLNPAFSQDGKYLITNDGIYTYTARIDASHLGKWTLQRNDTFYPNKEIFKPLASPPNNMIIWSWDNGNAGIYKWKAQINYKGATGEMRVIEEVNGTSFGAPKLAISPLMTKFVVYGNMNSANDYFYKARMVDWRQNKALQITVPDAIKNSDNTIVVIDDFLYAQNAAWNAATNTKTHYAYTIQGQVLVNMFTETIYPDYFTSDFKRTLLWVDGTGKLVIGYQFNFANGFVTINKDQRKKPSDVVLANKPPPYELKVDHTGGSGYSESVVPFGRYVWLDGNRKIQYVQFSPESAGKKIELATAAALPAGSTLIASSPSKNCVAIRAATSLKLYYVNISVSEIQLVGDVYASFVTTPYATDGDLTTAITNGFALADGCLKIKLQGKIWYKSGPTAFTKNPTSESTMTPATALYDPNMNYVFNVATTTIYKWNANTNDYVVLKDGISGTYSTRQLFISADETKIILFTQQLGTSPAWDLSAKLFISMGGTWASVLIPMVSTTSGSATLYISPDFETVGVSFIGAGSAIDGSFARIVYSNPPVLAPITFPAIWKSATYSTTPKISLSNNFLYYASNLAGAGNLRSEIYYQIDKVGLRLTQLNRKPLNEIDISAFNLDYILAESNNQLALLYKVSASPLEYIIRRDIGSAESQNVAKLIEAAVVIVNDRLYPCPPGCDSCSNTQNCLGCSKGYYLDSATNKCQRCVAGCGKCASGSACDASGCLPGRYYNGGACTACHSSCLSCTGGLSSNCDACKIGYYLNSDSCTNCNIDNCDECTATTGTPCVRCRTGFVWDGSKCIPCVAGCSKCLVKPWICDTTCPDGFQNIMSGATNTGCKPCPAYCKTCSSGLCTVCRDNYLLSTDGKCFEKCVSPCQTCNSGFPSQCTSCIGGYYLAGGKCLPDVGCNGGSTCTVCPLSYNLVSGICIQCQGGANCESCVQSSATTCLTCVRGYYINPSDASCVKCIVGCDSCNDASTCVKCSAGYTLNTIDTSKSGSCLQCDVSCATCYGSIYSCDTCAAGYTRSGWACVSNNNVAFGIKLDVALASFTATNAINFIAKIAEACGRPTSSITLSSVVAGSVIVSGSVDGGSADNVAGTGAALQSVISSGSSIDGLSVIGTSFTVNANGGSQTLGDDATYYQNNSNLFMKDVAIIVGIVIPIGIIIIFLIIIVLMKKGVICVSNPASKVRDASLDQINVNQKDSEFNTMRKK